MSCDEQSPLKNIEFHTAVTTKRPIDRQLHSRSCYGCAAPLTLFPLQRQTVAGGHNDSTHRHDESGHNKRNKKKQKKHRKGRHGNGSAPVDTEPYSEQSFDSLDELVEKNAVEATHCLNCGGLFCYRCASLRVPEQPNLGLLLPMSETEAVAYTPSTPHESLKATTDMAFVKLFEDEAIVKKYTGSGVGPLVTASATVERVSNFFGAVAGVFNTVMNGSEGSSNNNRQNRSHSSSRAPAATATNRLPATAASLHPSTSSRLRSSSASRSVRPSSTRLSSSQLTTVPANEGGVVGEQANRQASHHEESAGIFENLQIREFRNRPVPVCLSCYVHDVGYLLAFHIRLKGDFTLLFTSADIAVNYVRLHVPQYASRVIMHIGTGNIISSRFSDDEWERRVLEIAFKEQQRLKRAALRHNFSRKDHFERQLGVVLEEGGIEHNHPVASGAGSPNHSSPSHSHQILPRQSKPPNVVFPFTFAHLGELETMNQRAEGEYKSYWLEEATKVVRLSDAEIERNFDLIPGSDDNAGSPLNSLTLPSPVGAVADSVVSEEATRASNNISNTVPSSESNRRQNSTALSSFAVLESARHIPYGRADLDNPSSNSGTEGHFRGSTRERSHTGSQDNLQSTRNSQMPAGEGDSVMAVRGGDTNMRLAGREMARDMVPASLQYDNTSTVPAPRPVDPNYVPTGTTVSARHCNTLIASRLAPGLTNPLREASEVVIVDTPQRSEDGWVASIARSQYTDTASYAKARVEKLVADKNYTRHLHVGPSVLAIEGSCFFTSLLIVWRSSEGCFEHLVIPSIHGDIPQPTTTAPSDAVGLPSATERTSTFSAAKRGLHLLTKELPNVCYGCCIDLTGEILFTVNKQLDGHLEISPYAPNNTVINHHQLNAHTHHSSVPHNASRGSQYLTVPRSGGSNGDDTTNRQLSSATNSSWTIIGTPHAHSDGGTTSSSALPLDGHSSVAPNSSTVPSSSNLPNSSRGDDFTSFGHPAMSEHTAAGDGDRSQSAGRPSSLAAYSVESSSALFTCEDFSEGSTNPTAAASSAPPRRSSSTRTLTFVGPAGVESIVTEVENSPSGSQPQPPDNKSGSGNTLTHYSSYDTDAISDENAVIERECLFYAVTALKVVRAVCKSTEADRNVSEVSAAAAAGGVTNGPFETTNIGSRSNRSLTSGATATTDVHSSIATPPPPVSPLGDSEPVFTFFRGPFAAMAALFDQKADANTSELLQDQYGNIIAARNLGHPLAAATRDVLARRAGKAMKGEGQRLGILTCVVPIEAMISNGNINQRHSAPVPSVAPSQTSPALHPAPPRFSVPPATGAPNTPPAAASSTLRSNPTPHGSSRSQQPPTVCGEVNMFPCSSTYDAATMLRDYGTGILIAQPKGGKDFYIYHRHQSLPREEAISLFEQALDSPMIEAFVLGLIGEGERRSERLDRQRREERERDAGDSSRGRFTSSTAHPNRSLGNDEADDSSVQFSGRGGVNDQRRSLMGSLVDSMGPNSSSNQTDGFVSRQEARTRLVFELKQRQHTEAREQRLKGVVLDCPICYDPYNTESRRPCLCPSCGNTFCLECAEQLDQCSFCRAAFSTRQVAQPQTALPAAYNAAEDRMRRRAERRRRRNGSVSEPSSPVNQAPAPVVPPTRFMTNVALMHLLEGEQQQHGNH